MKRPRRADTVPPGQDSVTTFLYKICPAALWLEAERAGELAGSPVDLRAVADQLKWEVSRGGQLFPHLYAALPVGAVRRVEALRLGPDGRHVFADLAS